MKLIRTALLSLLCVALAPLGSSLLADAAGALELHGIAQTLDGAGSAEAAFIRRSKIRQRNTTGYKVVVVVGDDSTNNEVNSIEVVLEGPSDSGSDSGSDSASLSSSSSLSSSASASASADLESSAGNGVLRRLTLPLKVVKSNGNKRFVFNDLNFDYEVGTDFTMTSTMRDVDGQTIGEPDVRVVTVQDDGPATVRDISIRQLDDTNFQVRVLVVGDSEEEVGSLDVVFADFSGPEPIPTEMILADAGRFGSKAIFIDQTLTFEDPNSAADEVYNVVVDLKDWSGSSLGSSEYEVVVEGLDTADAAPNFCWDGVQNGQETGVDCGGNFCSPCLDVVDSFTFIEELSQAIMSAAAADLGLVVEPGTAGVEVSEGGLVAWTAGTEDGSNLVVIDGPSVLTVDGESIILEDQSVLTFEKWATDDGQITTTTTARTAEGLPLGSWTHVVISHREGLFMNGPVVGGPTPTGVVIAASAMYGDIIMGGMPLDDFDD